MPILVTILFSHLIGSLLGGQVEKTVQEHPARHYQIKAAYLYNFSQFVEWPDSTFIGSDTPLVIGVVGEDPFGSYLDGIVAGEVVAGHPMSVRRFDLGEEIEDCHILYINVSEVTHAAKIIQNTEGKGILTVSDMPEFLETGGMIQFIAANKKIRFQINPEASESAGLKISSKLLRLAEIVNPNKK